MTVPQPPLLSAVILAGGQSRRMGRDKAWLEYRGQPLITLAVSKIRLLGITEIFISGRPNGDYAILDCLVLHDLAPGQGPLGGIERGLHACTSPLLLVLAVDLPHLATRFLARLIATCDHLTGAVPVRDGEPEPLAAIYPKRCHALAREALVRSDLAARNFAAVCLREGAVRRFRVPAADSRCLANWNTPADVAP